jgi:hypothetical protein
LDFDFVVLLRNMADTETPISPVTANKPELTLSAASVEVNSEPVELDSTIMIMMTTSLC